MLKRWTWLALVLVTLIAFVGCSSDDDPVTPQPAGDTPFEAMAKAGAAYVNDSTDCPGIISATALSDNLADYTVIDIRAESAYLAGHIPGAYLSSLGTVLSDL
ncbi:MAG: rhodanese-like domain-containing protein, partial [Candidatus Krumholzibacteria bacterium]|nr:rhodanese-like domain-containing protein [Candidatus Krumholzibacteria bacterium]